MWTWLELSMSLSRDKDTGYTYVYTSMCTVTPYELVSQIEQVVFEGSPFLTCSIISLTVRTYMHSPGDRVRRDKER